MDLFAYLMSKKGKTTSEVVEGSGTSITLDNTGKDAITINLKASELSQDDTPSPEEPQEIHTIKGTNTIKVASINDFSQSKVINLENKSKNLFDKDNVIYNYYYDFNLNYVSTTDIELSDYIEVKSGESYVLNYEKLIATNTNVRINLFNENKTIQQQLVDTQSSIGKKAYIFTIPSGIKYVRFSITTLTGYVDLNTIMFNIGTTATDYEPFTYPIEYSKIGTYEDEFIKTSGKNLFDENAITLSTYLNTTGGTGTSTASNITDYIEIKGGGKYTLSYNYNSLLSSGDRAYCFYDENKNFISGLAYTISNKLWTFTALNNAKYVRFCIDKNMYDIMFNEGNSALTYEPYGTGDWYIKKNIGKVVLDENENWQERTNNGGHKQFYCLTSARNIKQENQKCNYGVFDNATFNWSTEGKFALLYNTYTLYLGVNDNAVLNDFKTTIASNNVVVYYPLATPTFTLLSDALQSELESIHSEFTAYASTTLISQTNEDLPFIMNASTNSKSITTIDLAKYILLKDE